MESAPISSGKILSVLEKLNQQNIHSDDVKGSFYEVKFTKALQLDFRSWKSDLRHSFKRRYFSW